MKMALSLVTAVMAVSAGCGSGGGSTTTQGMSMTASPDLAMAAAPSCADYCTAIMANCTGDMNQQYTTLDNCMNSCKAMPVGAAADTSGNTLGCRLYHAKAAKGDPATHCPHAGPGGAGACGTNCEGYCQIAEMYCTGMNQIYKDAADCASTCAKFSDSVRYNVGQMSGGSTACLLFHAQEASSNPADHCTGDLEKGDGGIQSVTCM